MNIADRFKRSDIEDRVYIGEIIENHYVNSELSEIIKYLVEDKVMEELVANNNTSVSSDRILGRVEMGKLLEVELKNLAMDKEALKKPNKRRRRGKLTPLAEDIEVPSDEPVRIGGQV